MMNQQALSQLMDRWTGDAAFRIAMRSDPLAAIENAGVQLSEEDKQAVAAFDWSLSDKELASRMSHAA